jgi:hypothetical protein
MSSFSLHEKVSGHEIKAWYLSSLGVDTADGEAAWDSFMDHKPVEFKVPKKPRASKKSSTPSERADAPYNEQKCDARVYKAGWGCQCTCKKVEGQYLCKRHQTEADAHDGMIKNGLVTGERPSHHYGDESLTLITWHDVEVPTKVKAKKTSGEKKVSTRKCSCCGETGHNKSKCPNKSVSNTPPAKSKTVDEIKAELAEAEARVVAEAEAVDKDKVVDKKKKEKKEKKKKKKKSKNSMKVEAAKVDTENPVENPAELEEDEDDKTVAYGGEEIEEAQTVTYGGDVADLKDVEDVEEQVKEIVEQEIDFKFEGVKYTRNTKTAKVEDDDCDEVGTWNNESQEIEFTEFGKMNHKMDGDREVPESVEESTNEDSDSGSDSDSDEE